MERTVKPTPVKPFDFSILEKKKYEPIILIWVLTDHIKELEIKMSEYEAYIKYLKECEEKDVKNHIITSNKTILELQNDLRNTMKYYTKMRFYIPSLPDPKTYLRREYEWMN